MLKFLLSWWKAAACAALLILCFALPGSDRASVSLILCSLTAALAATVWAIPTATKPKSQPRGIYFILICALSLAGSLTLPFFLKRLDVPGYSEYPMDPSSTAIAVLQLFGVVAAFFLGFRVADDDTTGRRLMDSILIVGGLWAFFSIVMHISDPDGIYGVKKIGVNSGRLTGAFSSPNSAGTLFGSISVITLCRVLARFQQVRSPYFLQKVDLTSSVVWLFSSTALALTLSRGAIFATVIATLFGFLLLCHRLFSPTRLIACVAGIAIFASLTSIWGISASSQRLFDFGDALEGRKIIFQTHADFASRHLLFGTGLGSFNTANNALTNGNNYDKLAIVRTAHNVYLQWFEETGLFGLIAIVFLNCAIIWILWAGGFNRKRMGMRILAILAGYTVFLVHAFSDYAFQEPSLSCFAALLLGCGAAFATNTMERNEA